MYQIYGKYCNHVWHRNWNLCAIQEVIFCCLFVWFCGVFPFSLLLLMVPLKIIYYSLQINVCDCNVNEWVVQVKQTYYFWRMSHSYHVCTSCYNTRVWNFELENIIIECIWIQHIEVIRVFRASHVAESRGIARRPPPTVQDIIYVCFFITETLSVILIETLVQPPPPPPKDLTFVCFYDTGINRC